MRAMVVREYGTAPGLSEFPGPAGPAADVLAASLNPVDVAVAAGRNPFRRPELPLVAGLDGVARRADGALVHFFAPAAPYGAFAEGCRWRAPRPYRCPTGWTRAGPPRSVSAGWPPGPRWRGRERCGPVNRSWCWAPTARWDGSRCRPRGCSARAG